VYSKFKGVLNMVNLYQRKIFDDQGKHIKTSLYFDYYYKDQKRVRRFINLYLKAGRGYQKQNKKTMELVNTLLIQENNKLSINKSISKTLEKEIQSGLLAYIAVILKKTNKNSLYMNIYKNLRRYLKHDVTLREINYIWLEKWKAYLLERCYLSNNSARAYFLKLNTVLNRAVREGLIDANPFKRVESIKSTGIKRDYLTLDELHRIAKLPAGENELIKRAFLFSCFTGLRRSSICNLLHSEIKDGQIQRRDEKTGDFEYFDLSKMAIEILKDCNIINISGRVFDGLTYHMMGIRLKAFLKPLQLDKRVSFHTARRTYATLLLTQGAELYTVSKLLGHADIKTTQIYANVINEKKKSAVNALPVLKMK